MNFLYSYFSTILHNAQLISVPSNFINSKQWHNEVEPLHW